MAQLVTYTGKGRAFNGNSVTLAGTQNVAFLSLVYSKYVRGIGQYNALQRRYVCWARGQARYILGGAGQCAPTLLCVRLQAALQERAQQLERLLLHLPGCVLAHGCTWLHMAAHGWVVGWPLPALSSRVQQEMQPPVSGHHGLPAEMTDLTQAH